jgi:chromosome segregation ATPase
MSAVWDKLFGNSPVPANDAVPPPRPAEPEEILAMNDPRALPALARPESSNRASRSFDSIGRRNEALRAQLDAIEYAFSNIDTIRTHFLAVLTPIDEILQEIERTKTRHLDAESKLITLTAAHEKLRGEHAELTIDRNTLALKQGDLAGLARDLETVVVRTANELTEAKSGLVAQTARAERLERELEDSKRRLIAVSEQLPSLRAEFVAKEKRLQEIEQFRSALEDRHNLTTQENRSLRARIEEMVGNASKLNRQINELEGRNTDARRRIGDLEASLGQETAAHAKLKNTHFDDAESHRLGVASLREEIHALTVRSEGAERLLGEARAELRERNATIRSFEQNAREAALTLQAREQSHADLEKSLAAAHARQAESDSARAAVEARASDLARDLDSRTTALKRAEEQICAIEARMADEIKLAISELEQRDALITKLRADLDAQCAARAFAEGALQSARQERVTWHRSMEPDANREKLSRLRA